MPPFNWFRREFDEKAQSEQSAESQDQQTAQPDVAESKSDSELAESAAPSDSQQQALDYLEWAKAAYQNIQKQQTATSATPTDASTADPPSSASSSEPAVAEPGVAEAEVTEPEAEEAKVDVQAAPEPTPELESDTAAETTEAPSDAEPATTSASVSSAYAAVEEPLETPVEEAVEAASTEQPAAATPFWMQANAERQERLERLKATAEEEPELEPTPQPAAATTKTAPPKIPPELVDFDEGFMWSAEILAAQGRRPEEISVEEITWLKRLRQGLGKTRRGLVNQLKAVVGQGPLNEDAVMEIEALLLQADVGIEATDEIISGLQKRLRQESLPPDAAIAYLKELLRNMLDQPLQGKYNATFAPEKDTFNIWLITGVNGAGKTTTIGKIAHLAKKSDYRCLIAAADTFRAAAVEQVKVWGQRSDVEVIANPGKNTDPAAVVYDAISAAQSRETELLLVDTAGRLQNKKNLMEELSKIRRIIDKRADNAKIESLLVLDATLGQNGLRQAEVFAEAAQLSGVVLTKLDGTAKGGIALAVVQQLGLPIRFIGAGEGIEDLRPFSSYEFVEALLSG
ncbi:MAG: signal recognition particle-docking protein FtsY [Thainema sp.]